MGRQSSGKSFGNFSFSANGPLFDIMQMGSVSKLLGISRSSLPMTAPKYGQGRNSFTWMRRATRLWWLVFRQIISQKPDNCGETHYIDGMCMLSMVMPGGSIAGRRSYNWWISSGWTILGVLQLIGKFRPAKILQ